MHILLLAFLSRMRTVRSMKIPKYEFSFLPRDVLLFVWHLFIVNSYKLIFQYNIMLIASYVLFASKIYIVLYHTSFRVAQLFINESKSQMCYAVLAL